jgi:lipopolysaccharide transport system ATP-binding protein
MSKPIVSVEEVGKRYRIGEGKGAKTYVALRDVLASAVASGWNTVVGRTQRRSSPSPEFWALRDVTFALEEGEVLGIIGRNGAGKSTLLKIMARVTEASEGCVRLRGRVASLLEVGTGFHPELTGGENIFLNGAILGMTRHEIRRKFDEIAAFAEVERFIDTPVKRYSTGMYMRLAFAVAAHLESEILIIDETLAVGDAKFQKKCFGRMGEVAASGRTVLFVSHNLNAVERMCTQALCLESGHVRLHGRNVRGIVTEYLRAQSDDAATSVWVNDDGALDHPAIQPLYFAIENEEREPLDGPARNDRRLFVVIRADVRQLDPAICLGFNLYDDESQLVLSSLNTDAAEEHWPQFEYGLTELCCELPQRLLNEGVYRLELHCSLHCREWIARPGYGSPSIQFEIRGGLSDSPYWVQARDGILAPEWRWQRRWISRGHTRRFVRGIRSRGEACADDASGL